MLRLEHVSKIYPTGEVLKDINWEVKPGDRIGLVGVNGAGKSTQLKIIAGEMEPTSGEVIRPNSLHIAYLTQEFEVDPTRTVREEFWRAFQKANEVNQALTQVHHDLEQVDPDHADRLDQILKEMDRLQRLFEAMDGYGLESRIEKILPELGFELDDSDRLVSAFSGGWQMRMSLGKILLQSPDLLLLDEPTNHLDLETIEWLEDLFEGTQYADGDCLPRPGIPRSALHADCGNRARCLHHLLGQLFHLPPAKRRKSTSSAQRLRASAEGTGKTANLCRSVPS